MTGKIAIVIGCLVVLPAVAACGLAYNGMSAEPDLVAMAGSEPVAVNGTSVSVPGTVEGSFTVAVSADPAANKALASLRTPTEQADAASALGRAGHATSVLRAGRYTVLKIGANPVYDYVFADSDGISVISVTTDVLPEEEVVAYIAAFTS